MRARTLLSRSRMTRNAVPAENNDENAKSYGNLEEKNKNEEKSGGGKKSPFFPFYSPSPAHYLFSKKSPARSPAPGSGTPRRFFKRPFPPPSPAKHIKAVLARRHGSVKPNEAAIPEGKEVSEALSLDKSFGFPKKFYDKYELGEEVGRGHFGYTCRSKFKKGELKGQEVAVKVIPKSKMTTAIAIEDVRKEVKILRALTGHSNLIQFYDAYEDHDNVYIVMEVGSTQKRTQRRDDTNTECCCILPSPRGGPRDLKPELVTGSEFLFTSKEENSLLKAIDFGLSEFVKPDERLNDIVGSAYYVAPEVLHRAYSTEADVWSVGVIAYILLCGSRPFWARTESGIFRAVVKAEPTYEEQPWPTLSSEAKDFVKRLLNKDPRKRMTAAQALCHPWIKNSNDVKVPLDILIFKLMRAYMRSSPLRKAALRALKKNATDAMNESRVYDFLASLNALQYRRMDFEEFCAAALSVYQLEALERWEQHARCAYELFEKDGNRTIMIEELASELGLSPSVPVHAVLHDWIRHTDGKLSFLGFVKLLHGVSSRSLAKERLIRGDTDHSPYPPELQDEG
ncbi:CDPK-related protein kinase [Sesamum angolense]|uniref:non-specific serine/threonine protein kinase n=1 Tax=Sesamum angolense TaxID=2727404 RepID=A0AAE1WHA1_9LAMI|nr:CDPK-related protein kinase [Sesamum angolense]